MHFREDDCQLPKFWFHFLKDYLIRDQWIHIRNSSYIVCAE